MTDVNTVTPAITPADVKKFLRYWWRSYYDEGYMNPIEKDFPKDAFNQEHEPLWWDDNAPQAQYVLGKGWRAFRVYTRIDCEDQYTNWFLIIRDVDTWECTWEWVHCRSYKEWGTKVLNKYLWRTKSNRWDHPNYNRLGWAIPMLCFEISTFDGALKPHVIYSKKDKEILDVFKYGVDPYERPVNPVYALACWIHTDVMYTDLGMKCTGDTEDEEWTEENDEGNLESFFQSGQEYTGLPDDLSVLIAHAVLVMADKDRASALLKIRGFVREQNDPWIDTREITYESCLKAAAHFWDY